jgi:hypothetical protein
MELWEKIVAEYPEITSFKECGIMLRDDSDGVGAYIEEWNYSKPIPEGLTLGKPKTKTKLG